LVALAPVAFLAAAALPAVASRPADLRAVAFLAGAVAVLAAFRRRRDRTVAGVIEADTPVSGRG
jgi:hypothetical protein